jgi:hypothetical protein
MIHLPILRGGQAAANHIPYHGHGFALIAFVKELTEHFGLVQELGKLLALCTEQGIIRFACQFCEGFTQRLQMTGGLVEE